ncbi:hypothetical protein RCL1_002887 [Eukaryota sp. TZLM3-RCL]
MQPLPPKTLPLKPLPCLHKRTTFTALNSSQSPRSRLMYSLTEGGEQYEERRSVGQIVEEARRHLAEVNLNTKPSRPMIYRSGPRPPTPFPVVNRSLRPLPSTPLTTLHSKTTPVS